MGFGTVSPTGNESVSPIGVSKTPSHAAFARSLELAGVAKPAGEQGSVPTAGKAISAPGEPLDEGTTTRAAVAEGMPIADKQQPIAATQQQAAQSTQLSATSSNMLPATALPAEVPARNPAAPSTGQGFAAAGLTPEVRPERRESHASSVSHEKHVSDTGNAYCGTEAHLSVSGLASPSSLLPTRDFSEAAPAVAVVRSASSGTSLASHASFSQLNAPALVLNPSSGQRTKTAAATVASAERSKGISGPARTDTVAKVVSPAADGAQVPPTSFSTVAVIPAAGSATLSSTQAPTTPQSVSGSVAPPVLARPAQTQRDAASAGAVPEPTQAGDELAPSESALPMPVVPVAHAEMAAAVQQRFALAPEHSTFAETKAVISHRVDGVAVTGTGATTVKAVAVARSSDEAKPRVTSSSITPAVALEASPSFGKAEEITVSGTGANVAGGSFGVAATASQRMAGEDLAGPAHESGVPNAFPSGNLDSPADGSLLPAHTTLQATQTVLEVGVPGGSHGWLKIRAEVGEGGAVQASMIAPNHAGQEMLQRELPAINAFLEREHLPVNLLVTHSLQHGEVSGLSDTSFTGGASSDGGASRSDPGAMFGNGGGSNGSSQRGSQAAETPDADRGERSQQAEGVLAPVRAQESDGNWSSAAMYGGSAAGVGGSWLNVIV